VTDFGKIYRSPTDDGAFTLWAFGSTSAVDTALGIDNFFADPTHFPIAAFKFQSLSLNGNPTIDLSNGGVTKLALIGVDGITSGPPGGTLTFTGLDTLVLATVNGPINLTSDISFDGLSVLAMYARGAGSNLTLNSPISNIGTLELAAEGSIQLTNPGTMSVGEFDAITGGGDLVLQIGGSLLLNGRVRLDAIVLPGATVASGANLTANVAGDYTNNSTTEFSRLAITNQGHIGTGGNIAVTIGGDLTATGPGGGTGEFQAGDFALVVQNTNGLIDNGGNLNLTVNGNVHVNGLAAHVQNYDATANPAGHIGTGGNIDIEVGGNLTANSYVDVFINNRAGGMIDSGGNLTFNVGGALTIGAGGADFEVSNRYDDIGGNTSPSTIGSDVSLFVHAASINIAGDLFGSGISNRGGSVINGNATVTWDVPGNVNIQGTTIQGTNGGGASWFVLNDTPPDHQFATPPAGTIHGSATVKLNIGGDLTIAGDASAAISNPRHQGFTGPIGGTIDSNAAVNIMAANFSVGGELDVFIDNLNNVSASGGGGIIGGNAAITVNVPGTLTATGTDTTSAGIPGDANFYIRNESLVGSAAGGFVGGDATINLQAGSISTAGILDVEIDNFGGGSIGGNASVNVGVSGDINIVGDATFQILNNDGGHIGGNANILVTTGAAGDLTANSILAFVNNHNVGTIDSGANITFNIGGALTTTGDAIFVISNLNEGNGGGTIGSLASVDINAASVSVGGFFQTFVGANGGGSITGSASNLVNATGNLVVQGPIAVQIEDTGFIQINPIIFITGGHIGGDATVTLAAQNITTSSTATGIPGTDVMALEASIYTNGQGTIGGNAIVDVIASQDISAPGTVFFTVANGNYQGFGPGTIGGDAQINVIASNLSTGALFDDIYNYGGASIGNDAIISLNLSNSFSATGNVEFRILSFGGTITRNASINVSAGDISVPSLTAEINNSSAGLIGGDATINLSTGGLSVGSAADVTIDNSNGGMIGGNATINMNVSGTTVAIDNSNGGMIGGNAAINVSTANISVGSLVNQINNTGGSIGASTEGGATINMNVSGTATVTNDATVAIYGSDGAASAAININGGNYSIGGTFLSYIDGNGTITFNNASAHADVLKAGVFGANGVLNIGGGTLSSTLSADTTLQLYAPGSNGQLNFVSSVTLGGNGTKILAANSVTIFNGVVVTVSGSIANVYTNHANYAVASGGNGTTSGTFGGVGANSPQSLSSAPAFDDPPPPATLSTKTGTTSTTIKSPTLSTTSSTTSTTVKSTTSGTTSTKVSSTNLSSSKTTSTKPATATINVANTSQLLSLLDGVQTSAGGKITISDPKGANNLKTLSGTNINSLSRTERRMLIQEMRDRNATRVGGRRIL
jgi:hypothetical protein